ncbi:MAG: choice-of-anchor Q domain-containing protein, partial [Planctomycetota bacterium]
ENNFGSLGGGMYNEYGSCTVVNCAFIENDGSGMRNHWASPTVTGCLFSGNVANWGGGMHNNDSSSPTVTNCTFSGNSASSGNALAFDSYQQQYPNDLFMANCVMWDGGDEIWNNDGSTVNITYTAVQGGWTGTGNIRRDPLLVDPDNGDFRLSPGSPCIDAGDNSAVPEGIRRDLDGNPRFVVGRSENQFIAAPPVDMGAYEYQPDSSIGALLRVIFGSDASAVARQVGLRP